MSMAADKRALVRVVAQMVRHVQYYTDPVVKTRPRYTFPEGMNNLWLSKRQLEEVRTQLVQMARGESGALSEYEPCPRQKHYPDWDDEDFQLVCDELGWVEWRE